MNGSLMQDAFDHHLWATLKLMDVCAELKPEQLEATAPGTYGSILQTMRHLVGADASYLFVLTGGTTPTIEEDSMDLAELRQVMESHWPAWSGLLAGDVDPAADVVRHRDDGTESHAPLGIRIAQVVHHGTDHRSQICTVLTTLGVEPPEIDVWDFGWQDNRRVWETEPSS